MPGLADPKPLLSVMAAAEGATGVALLLAPAMLVELLLGTGLDATAATVARVAGVALLALGIACWRASADAASDAAGGLVAAMLVYNFGVSAVLMLAAFRHGLFGIGLWPVAIAHIAIAGWCLAFILIPPRDTA
ncbi:hypothetical protein [Phyllobacterium pellucidum]|uniref:hypothetical protein n=1 Tax=Phyllobacterium pellucidum TaxID=2740464 RepID=UPI001D149A71|nr:hypothetical protein [Phyllobacterium sp. T1018]UGY08203.1 hypothetical protein LLE51_008985 [Phyllobacterium sp. T1018]